MNMSSEFMQHINVAVKIPSIQTAHTTSIFYKPMIGDKLTHPYSFLDLFSTGLAASPRKTSLIWFVTNQTL